MEEAVAVTQRRRRRRKKPSLMPRSLLWIVGGALIACSALLSYKIFGDTSSDYDRAMSDCISGHTQGKETLSGEDVSAIAASCASGIPASQ